MAADIICPQCKGTKEVTFDDGAPGSEVTLDCPTCMGEGVVDAAEADVYMQERLAVCDCPGGAERTVVEEGQTRCWLCGRLVKEVA
jgi:DnaJ-class molecular chaperone